MFRAAISVLSFLTFLHNAAGVSNLRIQEERILQLSKKDAFNTTGENPDRIPDPSCKRGVISSDYKACCAGDCSSCGTHPLCNDEGKYHEATGKLANNCCRERILKKAPSCEEDHPPCVLSDSYRDTLDDWKEDLQDRHAMQDCNKAKPKTHASHNKAVDKGEFLAKLFIDGQNEYTKAKTIAVSVQNMCSERVEQAKVEIAQFNAKIAKAGNEEKEEHGLTGHSPVKKWTHKREDAEAEVEFYGMITSNADTVVRKANTGLRNARDLKVEAQKARDVEPLQLKLDSLLADSDVVHQTALELWKQWQDSSKAYDCGVPPQVEHVTSMCKSGNTRYSPKCEVQCSPGYDGETSQNLLRCNKQGKFGKELHGEWMGMATCAGRLCGTPPSIDNGNAVAYNVRYPDVGTYMCHRGFFSPTGHPTFTVPCDASGAFRKNASHVCQAISCGAATPIKHTAPVKGTFRFTDIATYSCLDGYTVDEMPGGLQTFTTSCQYTGMFSAGVGCRPVRCGPPPHYENTKCDHESLKRTPGHEIANDDMHFGDTIDFRCEPGYTLDQKPGGADHFTLECLALGEHGLPGTKGDVPVPRCRPISAGVPPPVPHATFNSHEMFYGDSMVVIADFGYSTTGSPTNGSSCIMSVTTEGTFSGLEKFLPVVCGRPPTIAKATVTFTKEKASYGDLLQYECERGYSFDMTAARASASFKIQCEADGDFSKAPGLGDCVNIDDCLGHTCGPHGSCVDHLSNYTCKCESGFAVKTDTTSGEISCGNVDDCGPEACGVGKCVDLVNDYKCDCPEGYKQVEESHGTKNDKTCMPVSCGAPPEIERAAITPVDTKGGKAFYGQSVMYQCAEGHTLDGKIGGKNHFSMNCEASKKFTRPSECKPITCHDVPDVKMASTKAVKAKLNESIKFGCDRGHSMDGTESGDHDFTVTCQATGQFSVAQECMPVSCGEPVDVPNSFRASDKLVFGDEVEYECLNGFSLDGQKDGKTKFTVKCEEQGKLSAPKQCQAKICGIPLPKEVMFASTKHEGNVRYPLNTEVICRDGYTIDGDAAGNSTFVVKCLASGDFDKFDQDACKPVKCGVPGPMPNATLKKVKAKVGQKNKDSVLQYHDILVYECNVGFATGGELDAPTQFEVECGSTGHFNPPTEDMQCKNVNDCEGHTCGPKGHCVDLVGPRPAYTCECLPGYEVMTNADGEKHCGNTDDCEGNDCGVGVCKDLVGGYTCQCPNGYYIGLDDEDGTKTCRPAKCAAAAPSLGNGTRISKHSGPVFFPRTLRYECDEGYSTDGTVTLGKRLFQTQCRDDGQLHGMMSCTRISCGTAKVVPFTKLVEPHSLDHSINFKDKAKYECIEGHSIKGKAEGATTFEVECPADGHLTDPQVCEPVRCGEAPAVAKSRSAISGQVSYGQEVKYHCDTGYTLDGKADGKNEFALKCLKTGKFSKLAGGAPCQPIYASPPTIKHASLTEYAGKSAPPMPKRVTFNEGLEYRCNPGYSFSGSPSAPTQFSTRVTSTGDFSPAVSRECKKITYVIRGLIKDSRNGALLPGVTVAVAGTNISVTAVLGFFTLAQVPAGNITLRYEKHGYITTEQTFSVNGNIATGGVADISMSPEMASDQWRVVMKWGKDPVDLDAYIKWGSNKVCWANLQRDAFHMSAHLEHDDTTSFGPETMHISGVGSCKGGAYYCDIRYYVNDYTETGKMLDEMADITLYTGEKVAGQWHIKDCPQSVSQNRNWWHVFTVDGITNKLKWSCLDGLSPDPLELEYDFMLRNSTQGALMKQHLRSRRVF